MENRVKEKQEEIDFVELLKSLWNQRWFIVRVAGVVVLLGLIVALFGEVRYTASTVVVPQTGKNATGGNLQGLAAMAGINLGPAEQGELLSPLVYPMVVASVPFQKELMHSGVTVAGHDEPVTLLAYFTEKGYQRFSLFPFLKKYTLGLPGLIRDAAKGGGASAAPQDALSPGNLETLTAAESKCRKMLSKLVSVRINEKEGYIVLSATMPEALMAARTAARAQELLQDYITRFKVQKVQGNLDFIEARYEEAKADFEARQRALATFQDANRDISSAVARTRENKLTNEYDLAFSIYSEMARQREQAGIKVKEDTPIFTVVEPVTVPLEKSAPRRLSILVISLFLGLLAGAGLVLVRPWIKNAFQSV